jgi:hypothetical protein
MDKKTKINFHVLAIFVIIIFCFAITPKTLQNDTYYTIAIGEHILENGIDMKDPFSWHEDLPYTYPHWAYDVGTYLVYQLGENIQIGGFTAIYIATVMLSITLGIIIYIVLNKICKNEVVSFFITLAMMYLMKSYITARAQLVTYILFILTILFIEKFLETKKKRYAIGLIVIPIIIANVHLAVWPFYFVLYLPYIVEYILIILSDADIYRKLKLKYYKKEIINLENKKNKISNNEQNEKYKKYVEKIKIAKEKLDSLQKRIKEIEEKRKERRSHPYKIILKKNDNVKWLIIIMVICAFTGLLTPLGDTPYTYLPKTMAGNTMENISEHLPLTLIQDIKTLVVIVLFILILMFTDVKIKLRDLFMIAGLVLLAFMSRRQVSMFVLIGGIVFAKLLVALLQKYDKEGTNKLITVMTTVYGQIIIILLGILISFMLYRGKINSPIVNESSYPVEACDYILNNLDVENIRIYNEYNYGSYMLYRGIPVFIDSRADLYTPEFNGVKNEEGKYEGRDIFTDYLNISSIATYYENKFESYDITHLLIRKNSKLNLLLSRDINYKSLYDDKNFILYERVSAAE